MNFGENTTFVEIGHFYTNEIFCPESLNYLKGIELPENSKLAIFIDNYFFPEIKLDIALLLKTAQEITERKVELFFEGDMVKYYNQALSLLNITLLETKTEKGFTYLFYKGNKIAQLFPFFRPSCLMLSFTWSLFRLAQTSSILTIIDKKYQKLEEKVIDMLPKNLKDKAFYRFFS